MNEALSKLLSKTLETLRKEDKATYGQDFRADTRNVADTIELYLLKYHKGSTDAK